MLLLLSWFLLFLQLTLFILHECSLLLKQCVYDCTWLQKHGISVYGTYSVTFSLLEALVLDLFDLASVGLLPLSPAFTLSLTIGDLLLKVAIDTLADNGWAHVNFDKTIGCTIW